MTFGAFLQHEPFHVYLKDIEPSTISCGSVTRPTKTDMPYVGEPAGDFEPLAT